MGSIGVGTFTVTDRMRELVGQVLDTGRISYGPLSRQLEEEFSSLHGCAFGVLSNSGTSSLQVALQALKELRGWKDGDEVLVPSVTFVATANVVLHNRMTPVLVDVERDYYGMDPELIEDAIAPRTRAIMPVHLFGQPCDMAAIREIADRRGLAIIEDSCETMFVGQAGKQAGSWGDVGCFSMYVAHLLTAGVGGIATTNDPALAAKMRSLVNHGRDGIYLSIDDDNGATGARLREIVNRRFSFESIGHSFRITELEAALALAQLETWPTMIAQRQANAAHLTQALAPLADEGLLQLPARRPNAGHAFMMYPIIAPHEQDGKWALCNYLEERGIETREMLRLTDQAAYAGMWEPDDYPVAAWINRYGFYVGCHQDLTLADLDGIASAFRDYYAGETQ